MDKMIKRALGKSLSINLKNGGHFYFKVTSYGPDWIGGHDDEGLELRVYISDIDYAWEV